MADRTCGDVVAMAQMDWTRPADVRALGRGAGLVRPAADARKQSARPTTLLRVVIDC